MHPLKRKIANERHDIIQSQCSPIQRAKVRFPDIQLSRGNERVIADTKWKLVNESDRRDNYGISQSDVYQLFAYSRKYLAEQAQQRVVLIYPRTNSFQKPLCPFWYRQNEEVLYVLPYDLEADQLIVDKDLFLVNDTSTALAAN